MPPINRLVAAVVLLVIAAFCAFGFMATFESPDFLVWRIGYATVVVLCLAGIAWTLLAKQRVA